MLNRRCFIRRGATLSALFFNVFHGTQTRAFSAEDDASAEMDLFSRRKYTLKGSSILAVSGRVFINGYPVVKGNKVYPYSKILTTPGSEITLQLPDSSVFKIAPKSIVTFKTRKSYSGIFRIEQGSMMSVISPNVVAPYLLQTKLISFKLHSSVSFFEKLSTNQLFTDKDGKPISFDHGDADYLFCLCNGAMDLISNKTKRTHWLTKSEHHTTLLVFEKEGRIQLKKIPQTNHTDAEIKDLIETVAINPYPVDWLTL